MKFAAYITPDRRHLAFFCRKCGTWHFHGIPDQNNPYSGNGWRTPHCRTPGKDYEIFYNGCTLVPKIYQSCIKAWKAIKRAEKRQKNDKNLGVKQ